jgi:hypothetical protein
MSSTLERRPLWAFPDLQQVLKQQEVLAAGLDWGLEYPTDLR